MPFWQWLGQGTVSATAPTLVSPYWHEQTTSTQTTLAWITQTEGVTGNTFTLANLYQTLTTAQQMALGQEQRHYSSERFVARAPTIIRPFAEREAAFRTEIAQQQARIAAEQTLEARQVRKAADERAHGLLLEHLTPEQRDTFAKHQWFIVEGGRTKRQYRINGNRGLAGNVDVVGERYRLCAHLDHAIPLGDQLLAQKAILEFDEDHFLRIANRHG